MNNEQQHLLDFYEMNLARMLFDHKPNIWIKAFGRIVEFLENGEPEIAYLEGLELGMDRRILDEVKKVFDLRY